MLYEKTLYRVFKMGSQQSVDANYNASFVKYHAGNDTLYGRRALTMDQRGSTYPPNIYSGLYFVNGFYRSNR